jgi:hypothetical protein
VSLNLFVGVVLDADTYMNPISAPSSIFDYNLGCCVNFASGSMQRVLMREIPPPAHQTCRLTGGDAVTLARVNAIARQNWKSWSDVEPPRFTPGLADPLPAGGRPVWEDRGGICGTNFASISSICTTTSCRHGYVNPACRATRYSVRKGSFTTTRPGSPFHCAWEARVRATTQPAFPSKEHAA